MKEQKQIIAKIADITENDNCLHITLDDNERHLNRDTHVDVTISHENGYIEIHALKIEYILVFGKTTEHKDFDKIISVYLKKGHTRKFNWSKFKYEDIEFKYISGSEGGTFIPLRKEFWKKVKYESSNYIITDKNEK